MGATPQPPRNTPDGLIRWMKWVESKLSFILERLNNVLANTGLSVPSPGVTQVDGSLNVLGTENVSGTLNVSGNETVGGTLNVTGNTIIGGTLSLPNGIINNAALANPVRGDVTTANTSNFALSTSATTLASSTWALPSGFTSVTVDVTAKVYAINSTTGLDYVYARPRIVRVSDGATVLPTATPTPASGSGGSGTSLERYVAVVALAAGDSVRISVEGWTAFAAWAANASNWAEFSGSLTWYRA